jgi:hypothetical protein
MPELPDSKNCSSMPAGRYELNLKCVFIEGLGS